MHGYMEAYLCSLYQVVLAPPPTWRQAAGGGGGESAIHLRVEVGGNGVNAQNEGREDLDQWN